VASQEWDCGFTDDRFYSCRDCVLYVAKRMTRVRGRTLPQPGEGVTGPCYDISLSCCCDGVSSGRCLSVLHLCRRIAAGSVMLYHTQSGGG
jgi:hypothetical protein